MPKPKQPRPKIHYLDVPCSLCEKRHDAIEGADWLEIGGWGPTRRAHSTCFHEIMHQLREMPDGAFMAALEKRELDHKVISVDHANAATDAQIDQWYRGGPTVIDAPGDHGKIWEAVKARWKARNPDVFA